MTAIQGQLDINNLTTIITSIKDIILSLVAILTLIVAIIGLTAWKKELKGKSEYQLAKEVLMAVYKVREGFKYVRSAAYFSYEYPEGSTTPLGDIVEGKKYETYKYLYENRWKELQKAMSELEVKNLEAQVEWGPENHEKIISLRECASELDYQIWNFLEKYRNPEANSCLIEKEDREELAKENKKQRDILYDHGPRSNFTGQINKALSEFEGWLRPKIK